MELNQKKSLATLRNGHLRSMSAASPTHTLAGCMEKDGCKTNAWELGIEALLVQPFSDLNNVYAYSIINSNNAFTENVFTFPKKLSGGFRIDGDYRFSENRNLDINRIVKTRQIPR